MMARKKSYVRNGKWWSERDWIELQELRERGWTWKEVGKALKRTPQSCSGKYHYERVALIRTQGPHVVEQRLEIPASVLDDRDRRKNLSPPSLTAEFFGDPPQGYSALDRMGRQ